MQVATTTTTTTTTQQQLLPAPPTSSTLSANPSHSRLIGLPSSSSSPPSSSALNVYMPSPGHHHHQYLGHYHSQYAGLSAKKHHGRSHISDDEKEEIRMAFELFDSNKTGKLSYRELKVAMRALDFDVHKAEVKQLMEEHTKDGNTDEVDIDEFMDILVLKYKERDPDEELSKAFKFFDEDGTGRITFKNLRKVARDLGEHIPDEELGAMIEEFDTDQDGGINEEEFYSIMKGDDFDD
ncbi:hypothetical protein GOP47_0019050 [Adiantum capillus-veneris]|uniref:EF-hand domain-containing protein n=1 Tax=Adiantum capillus-veneris TaxID=13818 RepID=A0A9D4UEE1_ADICA|nr:hypothetical protein GOP47_0019050 [Adiantum capillus-veneris]